MSSSSADSSSPYYDVCIIGAGLSGICCAYYMKKHNPNLSVVILERRSATGGTWHMHTYPAIRSDSDAYTFSLPPSFAPWTPPDGDRWFAQGYTLNEYIAQAAEKIGADKKILFNTKVTSLSYKSDEQRWRVAVEPCFDNANDRDVPTTTTGKNNNNNNKDDVEKQKAAAAASAPREIQCRFVLQCSGYYSYDKPLKPTWAGMDKFKGPVLHPQEWDNSLDYKGKRVVVIGSGATAVTMVPGMLTEDAPVVAEKYSRWSNKGPAAHVTMLQRTPSWITPVSNSVNGQWPIALWNKLRFLLPSQAAFVAAVSTTVQLYLVLTYFFIRSFPGWAAQFLKDACRMQVAKYGKETQDEVMRKLGTPPYAPWDQRLAADASGALLKAVASGKADIVTDHIECFDEKGVRLKSGKRLDADIVVTATGLQLQGRGGAKILLDGKDVGSLGDAIIYRGGLFDRIPNYCSIFGYFNSSWTLKADLLASYAARKIAAVLDAGYGEFRPSADPALVAKEACSITEMTSGYLQRGTSEVPRQLKTWPWRCYQNYFMDYWLIGLAPLLDEANVKYTPLKNKHIEGKKLM